MSRLFNSSSDALTGTFTSTYADPVTLGIFYKGTHSGTVDYALQFGNSASSIDQAYSIGTNSTVNQWIAISRTTANGTAIFTLSTDGVWVGLVGVFTNDSLRDVYIGSIGNTAQGTTTRAVSDVLQFISVGISLAATGGIPANLAEVAIWNSALSAGDITNYLAGIAASGIAAANLIGYWPLSADVLTNEGTDAGGDLTNNLTTFDSDHPVITSGIVIPVFMNQYRQRAN
jgi:hypothetical protein